MFFYLWLFCFFVWLFLVSVFFYFFLIVFFFWGGGCLVVVVFFVLFLNQHYYNYLSISILNTLIFLCSGVAVINFVLFQLAYATQQSLDIELDKGTTGDAFLFALTFAFMIAYAMLASSGKNKIYKQTICRLQFINAEYY